MRIYAPPPITSLSRPRSPIRDSASGKTFTFESVGMEKAKWKRRNGHVSFFVDLTLRVRQAAKRGLWHSSLRE